MRKQRGFVWWIYLIAAGVILAALTAIVWKIHNTGYEKGRAEVMAAWNAAATKQAEVEQAQIGKAATNLEADRVKTRTVYRTITKSVDNYIDRPIYRNVCFDEPGLRDANAALRKATPTPASKPDAAMPTPDGAGQRTGWDGAAKSD